MGFWSTFIKVWQVRTSIRIQEGLENSFKSAVEEKETSENIPKILNEVNSKNNMWDREMDFQRNKTNQ